jgi:putative protein-disulfide isomerase
MKPRIIYCYDAYCGWCYGFSPVIKQLWLNHRDEFDFETLSGGMIPVEATKHIGTIASYIQGAYKNVEELTGVKFGEDYLWHIFNPEKSDWYPNSEMAAIALAIFRELHVEGRDLTDKEAYRHLLEKYGIEPEAFYEKLKDETYKEKAYYDFTLCKQLQVTGFPCVFLQFDESKLYMIARGYSDLASIESRITKITSEDNSVKWS